MRLIWIIIGSAVGLLISSCNNETSSSTPNATVDSLLLNKAKDSIEQSLITSASKPSFETIPAGMYRSLNTKLATTTKITPEQVIKMYYPAKISKANSYEKIDIQTEQKAKQTIITLTHDNQSEHFSIQGHRLIMTLEKQKDHWQIVALKQQFKCWVRDGNAAPWGTDKCPKTS